MIGHPPSREPREKTFAEVFPWRNLRRAMMLLLLIVAIVILKRSAAPLLARVGALWSSPAPRTPPPVPATVSTPGAPAPPERRIRLGPGLDPRTGPPPGRPHDE